MGRPTALSDQMVVMLRAWCHRNVHFPYKRYPGTGEYDDYAGLPDPADRYIRYDWTIDDLVGHVRQTYKRYIKPEILEDAISGESFLHITVPARLPSPERRACRQRQQVMPESLLRLAKEMYQRLIDAHYRKTGKLIDLHHERVEHMTNYLTTLWHDRYPDGYDWFIDLEYLGPILLEQTRPDLQPRLRFTDPDADSPPPDFSHVRTDELPSGHELFGILEKWNKDRTDYYAQRGQKPPEQEARDAEVEDARQELGATLARNLARLKVYKETGDVEADRIAFDEAIAWNTNIHKENDSLRTAFEETHGVAYKKEL